MTRAIAILLSVLPLVAWAGPCNPRITQAEAVRIAKRQIAKEWDSKAVTYFGPYTAALRDCIWLVRAATPPRDASGDVFISVSARTGVAHVEPRMRTDPRKLERLYEKRR
jgi:hypothetical protein